MVSLANDSGYPVSLFESFIKGFSFDPFFSLSRKLLLKVPLQTVANCHHRFLALKVKEIKLS